MYELLPFWHTLFSRLGFEVVVSPFSNRKLYQSGQATIPSDTACFPAKLSHGHIHWLCEQGVDAIFYPCMSYNLDEHLGDNHYNCPVVAYYPEVLEGNCPELKATKFIYDYFNLERRKDFYKKFQQTLGHYFPGLDRKAVHEAIDAAYDEYARHMQQLRDKAPRLLRRPAGKAAASLCWRAAPTTLTLRSTTVLTSSSSGRALPSSARTPSAGTSRSSRPPS